MSKLIRHDPLSAMPPRKMARHKCVNDKLTDMEPDDLDAWLNNNVRTVEDVKPLLHKLIMAVGALKR